MKIEFFHSERKTERQTRMTNLTDALRKSVKAPKSALLNPRNIYVFYVILYSQYIQ